jgi:hypothetical protein
MSKMHENITPEISTWIREQRVFFVATAPRASDGHINVSPKGGDSFRVLSPLEVAYQDFTGSGAETAAHARENGRIVVMFCAFQGPPKIVRIHGYAVLITAEAGKASEDSTPFRTREYYDSIQVELLPNDPAVCISPVKHRVSAFSATAGWRVSRQPLPICPERSHAGSLAPLGSGAGGISSKAARTRAMASSHASQSPVGPPPCRIHVGDPSRPEDTRPKSVSAASFGLASAQQVIY